jgi:hypothetical protein
VSHNITVQLYYGTPVSHIVMENVVAAYYSLMHPLWSSSFYWLLTSPPMVGLLKYSMVSILLMRAYVWNRSSHILATKKNIYELRPYDITMFNRRHFHLSAVHGFIEKEIFTTTYNRLLFRQMGHNYLWSYLNLRGLLWMVPYMMLGMPRLLVRLFRFYFRRGGWTSMSLSLFRFLDRPDNRLILKIGDKWYINGQATSKIIQQSVPREDQVSTFIKLSQLSKDAINLTPKAEVFHARALSSPKWSHLKYNGLSSVGGEIGSRTSLKTADDHNNYGLNPLINRLDGPKKASTILGEREGDLFSKGIPFKKGLSRELSGAGDHGWSSNLPHNLQTSIRDLVAVKQELASVCEKAGLSKKAQDVVEAEHHYKEDMRDFGEHPEK